MFNFRFDSKWKFRKQQKIVNCQNEKLDEYESTRMSTMAEMKFVENKLQSFDINAKPSVTHTQIEKLQKVKKRNNRIFLMYDCLFAGGR